MTMSVSSIVVGSPLSARDNKTECSTHTRAVQPTKEWPICHLDMPLPIPSATHHTRLPPALRQAFQEAYRASFERDIDAEKADRLGLYLLDTLGLALTILYESRLQRSDEHAVDSSADGRDAQHV